MQLRHRLGVEAQHKALGEQQARFDDIGPEPNRLTTTGKVLKLSDGLLLADALVSTEMLAVEGDVRRQSASHKRPAGQRRQLLKHRLGPRGREQPIGHGLRRRHLDVLTLSGVILVPNSQA